MSGPTAELVAQEICGCGMCELHTTPGLENVICDKGKRIAAFAAREVARETARLREALDKADRALFYRSRDEERLDWACVECRPDSDILKEGFQCAVHAMRARRALRATP